MKQRNKGAGKLSNVQKKSYLRKGKNKAASAFEAIVKEAISDLPLRFRRAVRNLEILVEEEPSAELSAEFGHDPDQHLLGLYVGVPFPERTFGEEPYVPDQIFIFRKPLEHMCQNRRELREQIRITVIHELAHYFGFDEDHLQRLGLD